MHSHVAVPGAPVHLCSRAQAIEAGMLVDCTRIARDVGFHIPVAMTRGVWVDCVEWTAEDSQRQTHQDQAGRLWDVVWMAHQAARRGGAQASFDLYRVPRDGRAVAPQLVTLSLVCGPGDHGEPVITILQLGED